MGDYSFYKAIQERRVYLGDVMSSLQGLPDRHAHLRATLEYLSRTLAPAAPHVLELGSWAGGSAITIGHALRDFFGAGSVVCVDEWRAFLDTRVNTAEVYRKMDAAVADDAIYRLFDHNVRMAGLEKMVLVLRGTTRRILPTLAHGQFHLAFVDASHLYSEVYEDILETMPLIVEGGILCGDDLEYQLEEVDGAACDRAVQEGRDYYSEPNSGRTYHPGVTRAVGELFGRVSAWDGFWALQRRGSEWLPISLDGYARVLPAHLIPEVRSSAGDPQTITVDGARYLVLGQQMTPCEIPCQALGVDDGNLFLLNLIAMRCDDQKP